jgi:hypothetical protein
MNFRHSIVADAALTEKGSPELFFPAFHPLVVRF